MMQMNLFFAEEHEGIRPFHVNLNLLIIRSLVVNSVHSRHGLAHIAIGRHIKTNQQWNVFNFHFR